MKGRAFGLTDINPNVRRSGSSMPPNSIKSTYSKPCTPEPSAFSVQLSALKIDLRQNAESRKRNARVSDMLAIAFKIAVKGPAF